jgi:hypothetical protein
MSASAASAAAARYERDVKTLADARREFARKSSPRIIAAGILALAALRVGIGDPSWRDAVAVAAALVLYPFGEWAIHVYLLHMRPLTVRGRRIDPPAARAHREHHMQPTDLSLILLERKEVAQHTSGPISSSTPPTGRALATTGRSGGTIASITSRTSTSGTGSPTTSPTASSARTPTRAPSGGRGRRERSIPGRRAERGGTAGWARRHLAGPSWIRVAVQPQSRTFTRLAGPQIDG